MIFTSCKSCIWAEWDNKTQTGCSLNRLDKFRENGTPVVEVYDEDAEFFLINGRYCMYSRNSFWGDFFPEETRQDRLKEELSLKYNVIVLAKDSLDDIEKTCNSFMGQASKPQHISVIFKKNLKAPKIGRILDRYGLAKWRLQETEDWITDLQAIDLCCDIIKWPYYIVIEAGSEFKEGSIEYLQKKIIDDLFQFGLIKDWANSLYVVPYGIHRQYSGNAFQPLAEKITLDGHKDKIFVGEF